MKKDAYYFKHFCNARNDRKLQKARLQLGIEAYALYFMLLEVLREEKDFKYPIADLDVLANEFDTSIQKLELIVKGYSLFVIDNENMFFSVAQIEGLKPWIELKETNRLKGIKSGISRRKKIENQIIELSEIDSIEPKLNSNSTSVEQLINKEKNKVKQITLSNKKSNNFKDYDSFISYMRANFVNEEIIKTTDRYTGKLISIGISQKGNLYNLINSEDFSGTRARELWLSLFELAQNGKLKCRK